MKSDMGVIQQSPKTKKLFRMKNSIDKAAHDDQLLLDFGEDEDLLA